MIATTHPSTASPKAYSYVRFSTPEQRKGHSLERQTDRARKYAIEHGLELDAELNLTDLGVSGYRLKNAKAGALGLFMRAVEEGRVPRGSYLLVENMDRLTRANMFDAVTLFMSIMREGITVVTLTNNQTYSRDTLNDDMSLAFMLVAELVRANQESARKGQMVGDAKERRRKQLASGELKGAYTRQTPAWLRWSDTTHSYQLIPERARIVREIFERADAGAGLDRIAREFNKREEPTWGTGDRKADHWRGTYLRKIVTSKAPIGLFTPHQTTHDRDTGRRKDIPLEPTALFPAVVDEELYWKVARRLQSTAPRGKNATLAPSSVVAGLLKCAKCGSTAVRVSKGKSHGRGRENTYLVCSRAHAKAKGCTYQAVRYRDVEEALRVNAKAIVRYAPRGKNTAALEREIENLTGGITAFEDQVRDAAELAALERTPAARELFRAKEDELERHRATLRELLARRNTMTTTSVRIRLKAMYETLTTEPFNLPAANAALKQAVKTITMDAEGAMLEIHWHHSDETQEVPFYSRHKRWERTEADRAGN